MNINVKVENTKLAASIEGRVDTVTAPQIETEVVSKLDGINELELDLGNMSYISSAGLRVLLACQKKMNAVGGKMLVRNPNEMVMEIFEVTGFADIFTFEND